MADKLKVVLVGCGGMSAAWLKTAVAMPEVAVAGLVDINLEAARKRRDEFNLGTAEIDTDLNQLLSRVKPDIVFDCAVPEAHVDVTLVALAAGCHVLGEKPMADSMENAHRMVLAAAKANRLFAVIQNRRYLQAARKVASFIRDQSIGALTTMNCDFYIGAHFGGFRDHMKHVLLLDMAIHTFDAARFLTGADPVAVYCKEWNPKGSWYDHDASAVAIFEMTNGVIYTYRGSWCSEGLNTTWESDWRFIGEHGSATWNGAEMFQAQVATASGTFISQLSDVALPQVNTAGLEDGHASLIREFVQCVRTGAIPETVCTDNIKSLAMVFGAIQSAESGQHVVI